jgi:hypothetical protein
VTKRKRESRPRTGKAAAAKEDRRKQDRNERRVRAQALAAELLDDLLGPTLHPAEFLACLQLGIPWPPTPEAVATALRVAVKKVHPDAGGNSPAFQQLVNARNCLIDYLRREQEANARVNVQRL